MYKFMITTSVIALTLVSSTLHANLLLNGFTLSYDVSKNNFHLGVSERTLNKKSKQQYLYQSRTYATGILRLFAKDVITERSEFFLRKNKIIPIRYDIDKSGGSKTEHISLTFNHTTKQVLRSHDNRTFPIVNNMQDLLGFQLAMMLALQNSEENIKFTIIDKKRLKEYQLKKIKSMKMKTDKGLIDTIVLESTGIKKNDRFIFWCAPKYDYLPIQIKRIEPDGDEILVRINKINSQNITFIEVEEGYD